MTDIVIPADISTANMDGHNAIRVILMVSPVIEDTKREVSVRKPPEEFLFRLKMHFSCIGSVPRSPD